MKEITPSELQKLLKESNNVSVIDVREAMEVQAGMIPDAIHIPLGEIQSRISELDKEKEYVIVCRSGNRSGVATQFLQAYGYDAANMVGGMIYWDGEVKIGFGG